MSLINEDVLMFSMCIFILIIYLIVPIPDIIFKLYKTDSFDKELDKIKVEKCQI